MRSTRYVVPSVPTLSPLSLCMARWRVPLLARPVCRYCGGKVGDRNMANLTKDQEIAALKAELASAQAPRSLSVKTNPDTGTVSLCGLRRFPIALYPTEWDRVFTPKVMEAIMAAVKVARPIAQTKRAEKRAESGRID